MTGLNVHVFEVFRVGIRYGWWLIYNVGPLSVSDLGFGLQSCFRLSLYFAFIFRKKPFLVSIRINVEETTNCDTINVTTGSYVRTTKKRKRISRVYFLRRVIHTVRHFTLEELRSKENIRSFFNTC